MSTPRFEAENGEGHSETDGERQRERPTDRPFAEISRDGAQHSGSDHVRTRLKNPTARVSGHANSGYPDAVILWEGDAARALRFEHVASEVPTLMRLADRSRI